MSGHATFRIPVGATVRDLATGRVGILRAFMDPGDPYGNVPRLRTGMLAYLIPAGGGVEWTTDPDRLERVK
ncbi:hypothetical protein [Streptomyces sp. CA-111067]|uniref:hypothetical protein n=1 Tax=Streptomyces sp. CA-111067 TaxID=3240046 RepID=UPI003D99A17B